MLIPQGANNYAKTTVLIRREASCREMEPETRETKSTEIFEELNILITMTLQG